MIANAGTGSGVSEVRVGELISEATADFQTVSQVNNLIASALQAVPENPQLLVMNDVDSDWE
jgi:hypothetical protein